MVIGLIRKIANAINRRNSYQPIQHRQESPIAEEHHFRNMSISSAASTSNGSEASTDTLNMNEFEFDKPETSRPLLEHSQQEEMEDISLNIKKESKLVKIFHKLSNSAVAKAVHKVLYIFANNPFTSVICRYYHQIMGRTFVVLIFAQTLSGLVVYYGVCRSWEVLGCIAHLIKGGIFFFFGIITFGRYLGAFANRGWAWNRVDNGATFSFEMIECCLIFVYGITNTWMEHFGQDSAWTHKDLEHASLAFMWWWCGLIGILVESRSIRRLLERNILTESSTKSGYSLNPFPALTVFMTGVSMGNHHQESEYSTKVHFMWGVLLASGAMCRCVTYLILFQNSPKDSQPTRPPSELLGAFLMIAGSILFMTSNSGTIMWLRQNNVDSMFLMNVCIALTSITLTYVASLQIIKAWAERREFIKKQQIQEE